MKLFFSPDQLRHRPKQFMVLGRIAAPLENPDRVTTIAEALAGVGLQRNAPGDAGREPILAVHDEAYVHFLETAHARWSELPNAADEILPNIHPYRGTGADFGRKGPPEGGGIVGAAGWYMGDMAVAVGPETHLAAYASTQTAIAAADAVLAGAPAAFGLCRPPGHHAYRDRACGFCFYNNAGIAAERLRTRFGKVAILDFDTHHGDGTQAIFYARGDVLVASVHTDPISYYPFYSGFPEERGRGPGEGANLNLPLPFGANDAAYVSACRALVESARMFGAEAVVLSAGWDAHRSDPLSKLAVTGDAFPRIGEIFASLGLPTVILQEGGYSLQAASEAAPRFVSAFVGAHRTG
jgi:acetoin utilization deacetylase AcuC-like enzyme